MKAYRAINDAEASQIFQGKQVKYNGEKAKDIHNYRKGIDYVHLFLFAESAQHLKDARKKSLKGMRDRFDNSLEHHAPSQIVQYEVPLELMREYGACGYYNQILKDKAIPIPQFAIPTCYLPQMEITGHSTDIKREWAQSAKYKEYLTSIPQCYIAGKIGFQRGYDINSVNAFDWQSMLLPPKETKRMRFTGSTEELKLLGTFSRKAQDSVQSRR